MPDIIVVDNDSNDGTFKDFSKSFDDIIILKTMKNYGGAGGFYIGEKYAYDSGYEYIILNDNDAYPVDSDLIESLVNACNDNRVVSGFNTSGDIKNVSETFWIFHYGTFKRETITKLGFVDFRYFLHFDDRDYHNRCQSKGFEVKKIYKRYVHPMKLNNGMNQDYFEARNASLNYFKNRRFQPILWQISKAVFYRVHDKKRFELINKGFYDFFANKWDNSYISKKIDDKQHKIKKNRKDFLSEIDKKNTVISGAILNKYRVFSGYKKYNKLSFLKNNTFITHGITYDALFFPRIYYVLNYSDKDDTVEYTVYGNSKSMVLPGMVLLAWYSSSWVLALLLKRIFDRKLPKDNFLMPQKKNKI